MLQLKDILLNRGNQALLRSVSLHAKRGQFTLLTGPNGSGKSLLMGIAAGKATPSIGQVVLCGEDALKMHGRRKAARLFYCNAPADPNQLCKRYQWQPLMLLDDPFRCLDTENRQQALLMLKKWQQEKGVTILFAAADPAPYLAHADQIVLLQEGRLAQQGTVEEIYYRPANLFVARYFGHCNTLEGVISGVDDKGRRAALDVDGLTLDCPGHPRIENGDPMVLCIRAEHLHVAAQPVPFGQNLSGVVVENRYLLSRQHIRVQLPSGQALLSIRQQESLVKLTLGQRAFLYWDADLSLLF